MVKFKGKFINLETLQREKVKGLTVLQTCEMFKLPFCNVDKKKYL